VLLVLLAPEVSNQPPAPGAVAPLIFGIAIVLTLVPLVMIGLRRIRGRGSEVSRRSSAGAAVGNALFELGSMLQPDRPNVETIVRLEEEDIEDDVGDGRDPGRKATPLRHTTRPPAALAIKSGPVRDETIKPAPPIADDPHGGHEHL
jgi:hypothetical protein